MIKTLCAVASWAKQALHRQPRQTGNRDDPWILFHRGRAWEARGEVHRAFHCHLQAGLAGLPAAATLLWLSYRTGRGVSADPIASNAWARRATEAGWPDVFVVLEECENQQRRRSDFTQC